jgi:dTDP-4-dehydrorhamnose reductase
MPRILVTGGSSYLGRHLVPLAAQDHQIFYTYYQNDPLHLQNGRPLDVRDPVAVTRLVSTLQPQIIIHTVGSNRSAAMTPTIVQGTEHITQAAAGSGARLIHISTDVIFNGRHAPYAETSPPAPLHEYGRAKAIAESIVARHEDHVIVRTSLIYGLQQIDRGTAWIVEALRAGKPVTLFTDQVRNPVWVDTLCHACFELAQHPYRGILHVAGSQALTRAEFGLRLLDYWQIAERDTLSFGKSDPDRWPADCTLLIQRAQSLLQTPLPGVDEVLHKHGHF